MASPNDGPRAKTYQFLQASFVSAATGSELWPGFDAAAATESADSRSVPAATMSQNVHSFETQVRPSLKYTKPRRQRIKTRSKRLKFCTCFRSWANLEMCYSKWGEIPESYEHFLLRLTEESAVAEDNNNLEGWTIQQMLSHVSGDAYVGANVILQAIRDVRARHQRRYPLVLSIRVSNITMWRKEIADWIKASGDHIMLVQETHLSPTEVREAANNMHRQGYQMYKGTKGGVAVLIKSHIQGRVEFSHLDDGCGFEAVDVRLQHTNLLVVSVYLKTGTSIHSRPNSSILAELLSLVKNWRGVWIIAGDFNTPPEEIAATNLLAEMNGCLCRVGVPTTDQGREIDYAIVHKALESLCHIHLDWAVPHKPHASLQIRLDMGEGLCPAMMLEPHSQHIEGDQVGQGSGDRVIEVPLDPPFQGEWLHDKLPQDAPTQHFAAVSQACSECVELTCPSDRGTTLRIIRRPLLQPTAPQTKRSAKCSWARALTWLKAAQKGEQNRRNWQTVVEWIHNLPAVAGAEDPGSVKFQLAEFLATGNGDPQPLNDQVERFARLAKGNDFEEDKAQYQAWLEEAQAGSMRPLFRTVKSHEATTVRPFGHAEPGLRPFLRFIQWQEIWGASDCAIERVMQQSQQKARDEAKELKALTGQDLLRRFRRLPNKAPGPDGWTVQVLKALPLQACEWIAQVCRRVEETGEAPAQWTVSLVVLMAKKPQIERPIALCHVVYKAWIKARYYLVEQWLEGFTAIAPWDAAVKGTACLDVSIGRALQFEIAKTRGKKRAALFVDLSTFYETICHQKLEEAALRLRFPMVLLNVAFQVYRGCRLLSAENRISPGAYAGQGILAGCPIAPALSKLALFDCCQRAHSSKFADCISVWLDDISGDVESKCPRETAARIYKFYKLIKEELGSAELLMSKDKSAFVCSDGETTKALRALLKAEDPKVVSVVKDLGVDAAGAARRRLDQQTARIHKASKRSKRLRRLKVQRKPVMACWGHQAQGLAPSKIRVLRGIASGPVRIAFGSSEVVFDMQDSGVKDPFCKVVQEHWRTLSQCLLRNKPEATRIEKAWEHTWRHLSKAKHPWRRCAGPMGAMVCYLMQLGFTAANLTQWQRRNRAIPIRWGDQASLQQVRREIDIALQEVRWEQVASQAGGRGSSCGLDWTAHHRLLKRHAKRHTVCAGLRMAWQGGKNHGGPDSCPRCGQANTLRHAILECPAWASFDLGVDRSWIEILPKQEDCFILRGLTPRHWTHHPPLTAKQLQPVTTGLLRENAPDISGLFVATDASGGPEGKDSRWRVVAWAAVIAQPPGGPFPVDGSLTVPGLEVVGTIKGALQVGSSVAEGESRALFEVAHRTAGTVRGCVDNKAAIAQAEDETLRGKWPHIWDEPISPDRYQLDWIKSHQTEDEFLSSRPQSERWKWALNDAADKVCGAWAAENTDHRFVTRAKDIDAATSAYNMFLARRCEHLHPNLSRAARLQCPKSS